MIPMVVLAILVLAAALMVGGFTRARRRSAELLARKKENQLRQEFVIARLDEIGKLIEDPGGSREQLQPAFDAAIAELIAADRDGSLAPLIEDSEKFWDLHWRQRVARAGNSDAGDPARRMP